jgi:putative copper resistance protein D
MFEIAGLAPIDGWTLTAIIAKAAGYGAALLAMGGPMFVCAFRNAPEDVLNLARKIATGAAIIGLAVLALRFGIRSARISGMGLLGATDAMMLGLVWNSPLGTAALWRGTGLILILAPALGRAIGVIGAVLIAASYTFIGHSLGDPRWLLAGLLIVHLLAAAFWIGALAPLHQAVGAAQSADLLHGFGIIASGIVGLLIVVGVTFAWFMTGSIAALFGTAYGLTLLLKVAAVTGLMGLAALNKWRLVPALAAQDPEAAEKLRRAIRIEMCVVAAVLIITATLTSVTTPPVNL